MPLQRLSLSKRLALQTLDRVGVAPMIMDVRDRTRYLVDRETRTRNQRFEAPDKLPLPPVDLVHKVVGHFDYNLFYDGGVTRFAYLQDILSRGDVGLEQLHSVLDWGCGCGRVLRQWRQVEDVQIYGSDYNSRLIAWCRTAFPFARLSTNGLVPPLPFPNDTFDLLYGISVFTHLDEPLQQPWIEELRRVVKPGGHILITVSGVVGCRELVGDERVRYDAGRLVVIGAKFQGRNYCSVVHPDAYVRRALAHGLELVAYAPAVDPRFDHDQDGYLLRVP